MNIQLIASCTMGLESVVANELRQMGYANLKVEDGSIEFPGTIADICRTNLWLRTADRVYLKVGQFRAKTFDELYDRTHALPWEDYIGARGRFPVARASAVKSTLFSKSDSQRIVKKAIVERLKFRHGVQQLPENGPTYAIRLQNKKDTVTLMLDTSGQGLHMRGYRIKGQRAPIRETLAAGLILLSRWRPDQEVFMDPTCGTGTLLIEAAMIAKNMAPGGNRYFDSEKWPWLPKRLWMDERDNAYSQEKADAECRILGSDIDGTTLDVARDSIVRAGFESDIFVQKLALSEARSKYKKGMIFSNPPYGERLEEKVTAEKLYREMGNVFRDNFPDWSWFVITPYPDFERLFGKKADRNRKLYNGGIKCYYYQFLNYLQSRAAQESVDVNGTAPVS